MPQCQLKDFRELTPHLEKIQSHVFCSFSFKAPVTELPQSSIVKVMVAFVCVIVKAMEEIVHLRRILCGVRGI